MHKPHLGVIWCEVMKHVKCLEKEWIVDIPLFLCRRLLGSATEFYKFDDDVNTTDDFGFCHVFYDDNNECEAIEIFDEAEVYVNELLIFPTDFETAKKAIGDFEQDDEGLISISKSIGIYAPDGDMESILFAKEDYYNDET